LTDFVKTWYGKCILNFVLWHGLWLEVTASAIYFTDKGKVAARVEGGLEYLRHTPANRRRRKGNPVPGAITGPFFHWRT
jgi:hypothetical protein